MDYKPVDYIELKGINNKVNKIRVLGTGKELESKVFGGAPWRKVPGVINIYVPGDVPDKDVTVIAVELDGKLDLFKDQLSE